MRSYYHYLFIIGTIAAILSGPPPVCAEPDTVRTQTITPYLDPAAARENTKPYRLLTRAERKDYNSTAKYYLPSSEAKRFSGKRGRIVYERMTGQHFIVGEMLSGKTARDLAKERLIYLLAAGINRAAGETMLALAEVRSVPVSAIDAPELARWAHRKGLQALTLIRSVGDYATDTSLENPFSIEAQIPFYILTRDRDHQFAAINSVWIKKQHINISFDHDHSLRPELDAIDDFLKKKIPGERFTGCRWCSIFYGNYILSDDQYWTYNVFIDYGIDPSRLYTLNDEKLRTYTRRISDKTILTDRLIADSVTAAGFEGEEKEELIFFLTKWRDNLPADLGRLIALATARQPSHGSPHPTLAAA